MAKMLMKELGQNGDMEGADDPSGRGAPPMPAIFPSQENKPVFSFFFFLHQVEDTETVLLVKLNLVGICGPRILHPNGTEGSGGRLKLGLIVTRVKVTEFNSGPDAMGSSFSISRGSVSVHPCHVPVDQ